MYYKKLYFIGVEIFVILSYQMLARFYSLSQIKSICFILKLIGVYAVKSGQFFICIIAYDRVIAF